MNSVYRKSMGGEISIRAALPKDIEEMVSLLEILFALEEDFEFNRQRQQQGLAMLLNSGYCIVLVAEMDDVVVGMCTGQTVISTAEGGPSLLVEDLVVREDVRGRGVGRALISTLTDWARLQGIHRMQLLADKNNQNALSFYECAGWHSTELVCLRSYSNRC